MPTLVIQRDGDLVHMTFEGATHTYGVGDRKVREQFGSNIRSLSLAVSEAEAVALREFFA